MASLCCDPHKRINEVSKATIEICVARYEAFGTAGDASKIRSFDLDERVKCYDSGELNPTVY